MAKKRNVHLLMSEIGPFADLMAVAEYEEDNLWRLMVDEETIVDAQYDESQDCLVLSAEVAVPNATERLKLYSLLLEYNGHWEKTGGVYMSLEEETGPVIQTFRCSMHDLDRFKFRTILSNFTELLQTWRKVVSKYDPAGPEDSPLHLANQQEEGLATSGFIRG